MLYEIVKDTRTGQSLDCVLLATKDPREPRFSEVLKSIRDHLKCDVIIVDDGSSSFPNPLDLFPCVLIRIVNNIGVPAATNIGLSFAEKCGYRLCFRSDDDDLTLASRLDATIRAFERNPSAVLVAGRARDVDADGMHIEDYGRPGTAGPNDLELLVPTLPARHATYCLHLERLNGRVRYDEYFALAQDYELIFSAAKLGDVIVLPDIMIEYLRAASTRSFKQRRKQLVYRIHVFGKHLTPPERLYIRAMTVAVISLATPSWAKEMIKRIIGNFAKK